MGVEVIENNYQPVPTTEPVVQQQEVKVEHNVEEVEKKATLGDRVRVARFKLCILLVIILQFLFVISFCAWYTFIAPIIGAFTLFTRSKIVSYLHFTSAVVYYLIYGYIFIGNIYLVANSGQSANVINIITSGIFFICFSYLVRVYVRYLVFLHKSTKEQKDNVTVEINNSAAPQVVVEKPSINTVDSDTAPLIYPGNQQQPQQFPQQPFYPPPQYYYAYHPMPNNGTNNNNMAGGYYYPIPFPQQQQSQQQPPKN